MSEVGRGPLAERAVGVFFEFPEEDGGGRVF